MKRLLVPALATFFSLAILAITPAVALGQTAPKSSVTPAATKLSLDSSAALDGKGRKVPGVLVLSAVLTTDDGKPLNTRTVDFYQRVDLMGPRNAYIGGALTDSTGVAALRYESSQSGHQQLLARFAGSSEFAGQEASEQVNLAQSGSPFKSEPLPLGSVGQGLAIGVGLLGLAVWILLLGTFVRTITGIRRCPIE